MQKAETGMDYDLLCHSSVGETTLDIRESLGATCAKRRSVFRVSVKEYDGHYRRLNVGHHVEGSVASILAVVLTDDPTAPPPLTMA